MTWDETKVNKYPLTPSNNNIVADDWNSMVTDQKDRLSKTNDTIDDVQDGTTYVKTHNDFTDALLTKLNGISEDATAYTDSDAQAAINSDADHGSTADHDYRTNEEIQDVVGAMVTEGTNVTVSYDDTSGTITINSTYTDTQLSTEEVEDIVGALIVGSGNTTVDYSDATSTLTISTDVDAIVATHASNENAHHNELHTVASHSDTSVTGAQLDSDHSKLATIETNADVTDTANVNAAGAVMNADSSTASMQFVVDEDDMSSNSATKVPTQQSVKAYVDTEITGASGDAVSIQGTNVDSSVGTPSDGDILVYRTAGSDFILEAKPASGSNPALNDVTDVEISSVTDNDILAYDTTSGDWINQSATGAGFSSVATSGSYDDLSDKPAIPDGTVTSVALSGSDGIEVDSGSPLTTSGTIALGVNKAAMLSTINVADGAEVNNISDANVNDLTDSNDTSLHYHSADRDRSNHTGTQPASTISDFDTEVSNNSAVVANTAKVTNATHTGDVSGSTEVTINPSAITLKTQVTPDGSDYVLISDTSDSGYLKKSLMSEFMSDGDMLSSTYDPTSVNGDAFDMDNMVESDISKVMTDLERDSIATISSKISNVVDDTTPQLGGDLDSQNNDIHSIGKLLFGTDTTASYIWEVLQGIRIQGKDSVNVWVDGSSISSMTSSNVYFYAPVDMNSNAITDLATPTAASDAATKGYVDDMLPITASDVTDFDTEVGNHIDVTANTTHRGNTSNPHSVDKTDVGLSNVVNDLQTIAQSGGKNIWVQSSEPTAVEVGDIWIQTS